MVGMEDIHFIDGGWEYSDENLQLRVLFYETNLIYVSCSPINVALTREKSLERLSVPPYIEHFFQNGILHSKNGQIQVEFDGWHLTFYDGEKRLLEEYLRKLSPVRRMIGEEYGNVNIQEQRSSALNILPRKFISLSEENYHAYARFEADPSEKIIGLGAYQDSLWNKNGGDYELAQRNSQNALPFYISDKGYGFIWHSSAIGRVTLGNNRYTWESQETKEIHYTIFCSDSPKGVLQTLTSFTGRAPMMDQRFLGLWQSKLRYQTTQEVNEVFTGYKFRNLPLSVIVIDYFHWTEEGDYCFDQTYWRGIERLATNCREAGVELMISVWPTVSKESRHFKWFNSENLLIQNNTRTKKSVALFNGSYLLDLSRSWMRIILKYLLLKNYRRKGIQLFWADQAEPELDSYHHNRYSISGINFASCANRYSLWYLEAIPKYIINDKKIIFPTLIRNVWFGSQEQGALAWSGDIEGSFESLREQIRIGLSMGICGQSWWTTDIGGFHEYKNDANYFRELLIRWFQFATFTPILRMHGDRQPHTPSIGKSGGGIRTSGASNEIWSFGEKVEQILTKFLHIREILLPYLTVIYTECHLTGLPLMRPLFLEFPSEPGSWEISDFYMFGSDLLVCPVTDENCKFLRVYLPRGYEWVHLFTKEIFIGGMWYDIGVSLENIPVFRKSTSSFLMGIEDKISKIGG
ncbi:glycoside hydrolase family 31 protein [Streptococcus suis]